MAEVPKDDARPQSYRASLLDRLMDDEPGGKPERPPFRVQTRSEYARALVRDLNFLFNTRTTKRWDLGEVAGPRSSLDFGVDDFTHLSPQNYEDRNSIARIFREAIVAFEPRLRIGDVTVEPVPGHPRSVVLRFDAELLGGDSPEPVSFGLRVDQSEGTVKFDGR